MKTLMQYAVIAGGGSLGAVARYALATFCATVFGTRFPIGTFVINVSGSFFLGWFLTLLRNRVTVSSAINPDLLRLAIAVGFTGAYTTFSTYMYESHSLLAGGSEIKVIANLFGSLLVGLLAVHFGIIVAQKM